MSQPLMSFGSHVSGRKAHVEIYPDRVEFAKPKGMGPAAKLAVGWVTGGVSLLATGVRSKGGSEVIPVKAITSVVTRRDGLRTTSVVVTVSNNAVAMRVDHDSAEEVKALLTQLMLGTHPSQAGAPPAPVPAAPQSPPDATDQIVRLAELRDQGILTEEEFTAKKAQLLGL